MINIAVVLGNPSSDICARVSKLRDDLNLIPYESLGELFRESEYSQYSLNRVVVSSSVLSLGDIDSNISRIRDLIRGQSDFANVVFLCKEETDLDLEELLNTSFNQSECAVLSITSSSITSIIEYLSKDISALKLKYGFVSKVENETTMLLDDSVEVPQPEESVTEEPESADKKRSGFLESLFGKSKKKDSENVSDSSEDLNKDETEVNIEGMSKKSTDVEDFKEGEQNQSEGIGDSIEGVDESNEDTSELSEDSAVNSSLNGTSNVTGQYDSTSEESDSSVRSVLEDVKASPDLVEVSEDINLINFGAEDTYREKTARVVEKVVEVERVVTVGSGKRSVFDKSIKKLVVVTGDRRSGVTSLAYKMAVEFSKHSSVLYVDCDMIHHGVLFFIDYDEFKKQDKLTRNAVVLCRTWEDIQRGVFRASSTLDVLTADYGCTTDGDSVDTLLDIIADYYTRYDCVIVDLPLAYLRNAYSILSMASPVVTVNGSLSGVLSFISEMEIGSGSGVMSRYMNVICKKGTMVLTGVDGRNFRIPALKSMVESTITSDYPWMQMKCIANPELDENSLSYMLEV